jgi:hypothetical protein
MVVVPVAFNSLQFWIMDEFLRHKRLRKRNDQDGTGMSPAEDLNSYDDDAEYERKRLSSDNSEFEDSCSEISYG